MQQLDDIIIEDLNDSAEEIPQEESAVHNEEVQPEEASVDNGDEIKTDIIDKKKAILNELLEYVIIFVVTIGVVWVLESFFIVNAQIPSASMENTIMTGDRIIGNRLAYKNNIPHRFDIIIFRYPDDESQLFIKRIIGLPGETVNIINGQVFINDELVPLDDSFTKELPTGDYGPYYVPSDSYFVMGDNRNNSRDSRFWNNTFVRSDQILGRAVCRYYPFNQMGKVE